jgi:hypothetical protein
MLLKFIYPFRGYAKIHLPVENIQIVYGFNRPEEGKPGFDAVGSAISEEPVVKPFAISDPMTGKVECQQRYQHKVDALRICFIPFTGFRNTPFVHDKFRSAVYDDAAHFI